MAMAASVARVALALADGQPVAMPEQRRAADDLDVAEPEAGQVVRGQLAAHADGRTAVEDGRDEVADGVLDGRQPLVSLSTVAWWPTPRTTTGMRSRRMSAVWRTRIGS